MLGELPFMYVLGRVDISYEVTFLARYSSVSDRCHYLALKRLSKYLRRTINYLALKRLSKYLRRTIN
jgi:hypothetical protein